MSGNETVKEDRPVRTLSRIGRRPIPIPHGVEVEIKTGEVTVTGPMGTLTQRYHPEVRVAIEDGAVIVERLSERKFHHALHGLTRSLIANAVQGVTEGYTKTLELMGVGYRVLQDGPGIVLSVGFSHTVGISPPEGVTREVEGNMQRSGTINSGSSITIDGVNDEILSNGDLELHVANGRAFRLETNATSPNLIGGYSGNAIESGTVGATIGGGGGNLIENEVLDDHGTIAGGVFNRAGLDDGDTTHQRCATVGGGAANAASGRTSTVAGGDSNNTSGMLSAVDGGNGNTADGEGGRTGGGRGKGSGNHRGRERRPLMSLGVGSELVVNSLQLLLEVVLAVI